MLRLLLVTLLCLSLPNVSAALSPAPAAAAQDIYTDALAVGWSDWSWATVDLQAAAPVHSGSRSIAVTYDAWQGLYLHYPEFSTAGFSHLRFFIHGGSSGGQQLNVYATYAADGSQQNGPSIAISPPTAAAWSEVRIALADLGVAGIPLTGLVWQDATGGAQPTLYVDDVALVADESPDGPTLSGGYLLPRAAPADGSTDVMVRVQVDDPQGLSDVAGVVLDGRALGRGEVALRDDGRSNDGTAADGIYGGVFTVAPGTASSEQILLVTAQDRAGHRASLQLGAFVVLAPPGGEIPSVLPQRIGWGSNAWSETPGQDWQVNSGVPWDFVYQYITYDWYVDGWGGNFVGRFVNQAWSKGYVPLISVYMMLGLPPTCGESGTCYASKLQNPGAVSTYLAALEEAARQAQGTQPVILHLEPDFYGFMQQLSNMDERPAGVQPDDPSSYPVALNVAGYPNTLAGFGQRMVDVVHATAPNALVAPMASMWATNQDPNSVTISEVISIAQRTAAFVDAMGGDRSDLLLVEWSDRDAGSGLRPWWDDTDLTLPRPTRAILWENALSAAARKRLILWQMPVGNMSLDNTCDHYQDNRAAYAFQHPRDLFDAGVFAILFGGGAECQTQVTTDGGFVGAQGAIAYAPPSAPAGFAAGTVAGPFVPVHWDENSEPDVWGYRISYQPAQGGSPTTVSAGRKNALLLSLPGGDWTITVATYDAMGQVSPASMGITVTTTAAAHHVYLPLIRR
ncbi:MAG: fibronectin type III domain-containing protein [Anaerolineae bacterium]|nr:fibronectin type III domain-containing protein [Anaerolineae bacterium]